jgi:TM2 domain-containing membrane protein YozV
MRIALLLLFAANIYAADTVNVNIHSVKSTIRFADFLFTENDFLRASLEYEKIYSAWKNDTVKFKNALSNGAMNKYEPAQKSFTELLISENLKNEAAVEYCKTRLLSGQYYELRKELDEKIVRSEKYGNCLKLLYMQSQFADKMYDNKNMPDFELFPSDTRQEATSLWNRKIHPGYKVPAKAALLSFLLPGAGKLYTGEYSDAAFTFLFTGLFSYLALHNLYTAHDFKACLFTGLGAYFYAGGIYGSAASARLYNYRLDIAFDSDLNMFMKKNNYFTPAYDSFFK